MTDEVPRLDRRAEALRQDLLRRVDTRGDQFQIELGSETITDRGIAGELLNRLGDRLKGLQAERRVERFAGFELCAVGDFTGELQLALKGAVTHIARLQATALGTTRSLEHAVNHLDDTLAQTVDQIAQARKRLVDLKEQVDLFKETCGDAVALEHNGDLFSCDHFVHPQNRLGNILNQNLGDMVRSPQQRSFGTKKQSSLPQYCLDCDVRFACNGECPKNRLLRTPDGQAGLNYLCAGYKNFFHHVNPAMRGMAWLALHGRSPAEIMNLYPEISPRKTSAPVPDSSH